MMRELKSSGVKWIGDIPSNWRVENPRWHFVQRKDRAKPGMTQVTASQKYGVITQTEYMEITGANIVTVQKDFDILKMVCEGDFVIHMRSFQGGLEYSERTGSISSAYVMLIPQATIADPRYYKWYFKSANYIDALSSTSNLVRDGQAMRYSNFVQLPILLPPDEEQTKIAKFLDKKCAEIDELIRIITLQISSLEKFKKATIAEAVFQGLNANSEMKHSGYEWLGYIPSHWTCTKIGALYKVRNQKVSDKDFPPLSVTMKGILPQLETAAKTNDGDNRKLVRRGDFAINSRSDRRGSCGISDYDGSVSLINTVLTPTGQMNARYYNWLFHTIQFADEFYRCGHGIVDDLWTTTWQEMKKIVIPTPSLDEQVLIADYLDVRVAEIESCIDEKKKEIEAFEAYKKSIIFEYVTGKKEVDTVE